MTGADLAQVTFGKHIGHIRKHKEKLIKSGAHFLIAEFSYSPFLQYAFSHSFLLNMVGEKRYGKFADNICDIPVENGPDLRCLECPKRAFRLR